VLVLAEERLAKLEGRIEELSKRIGNLRNDMNHRFNQLRSKWIVDLIMLFER